MYILDDLIILLHCENGIGMAKIKKTNAIRLLDSENISYIATEYDVSDNLIDGVSVAQKVGKDPEEVFKTLVTVGHSGENYVFVIPVTGELDLKKAAKAAGEKKIEMIPMKDLLKTTGYVKGGCSPLGMKKSFSTFVDEQIEIVESITFSGGKVGLQLTVVTGDFLRSTGAQVTALCV